MVYIISSIKDNSDKKGASRDDLHKKEQDKVWMVGMSRA